MSTKPLLFATALRPFCQIKIDLSAYSCKGTYYKVYYTNITPIITLFTSFSNYFMNEIELSQLRDMLPRGYRVQIKEATNLSYSYIDQVMSGKKFNLRILEFALKILEEQQLCKKSTSMKFRKILNITKR